MSTRPIILLDFDGVIHANDYGYQDGKLYGEVIPGFFEWFTSILDTFRPVIFSVRCTDVEQQKQMSDWFIEKYDDWAQLTNQGIHQRPTIEFTAVKIRAQHYIDDRALRFNGDWQDPMLSIETLQNTHPWNRPDGN